MKSILLATSEKRTLDSIGAETPSPMLPVLNRPVMMYGVELLYRHGFRDILVNLYDSGEQIEAYFGDGLRWGVTFNYILQRTKMGTAGTLRRNLYHLDDTFIVIPADIIINFDVSDAVAFHKATGSTATLIVQPNRGLSEHGQSMVTLASSGAVVSVERSTLEDLSEAQSSTPSEQELYTNTGVYIFEVDALDLIPKDQYFDIVEDLIPELLAAGKKTTGYVHEGYWNPLTTPSEYADAQSQLLNRLFRDKVKAFDTIPDTYMTATELKSGVWYGKSAQLHPQSVINPPVLIGEGAQILAGCEIGPNVVVGDYSVIGESTNIANSTVLKHTYVGRDLDFEAAIFTPKGITDVSTGDYTAVSNKQIVSSTDPSKFAEKISNVILRTIGIALAIFFLPLTLLLILVVSISSAGSALVRIRHYQPSISLTAATDSIEDVDSNPQTLSLLRVQTRTERGDRTPVGAWLEKYDLHRLPELWQVAWGSLRLVGTEPISANDAADLQELWAQNPRKSKAGFTGFWYTQANMSSSLVERTALDAYYIATRNLSVELREICVTPFVWFRRVQRQRARGVDMQRFENREKSSQVALSSD